MTKDNIWIIAITIAVAISVVIVWKFNDVKAVLRNEKEQRTETVIEDKTEESNISGPLSEEGEALFDNAKYLTVEKVIRTTIEDIEGNSNTRYDTYIISDIDLTSGTDQTEDYSEALVGGEFDKEKIQNIDFSDTFGIDYAKKSGWKLYEDLLSENGINGNLDDVIFDEDTYETTKQKLYVLNDRCDILDSMLENVVYDEVLESKVLYQTTESEKGVIIPDSFTVIAQYQKGNQTVTKSLFLQVSINNWNTEEEG